MERNLSNSDILVRLLTGALFAVLCFTGVVSGTAYVLLLLLAGVLFLTAYLDYCPLYAFLGINTFRPRRGHRKNRSGETVF